MRSMVEGALHARFRCGGPPPPRGWRRAVPLPVPGRVVFTLNPD
jgi:hypothetical protein